MKLLFCCMLTSLVAVQYSPLSHMSIAEKASLYCRGKVADFPPLEATVKCLYVRHMTGNQYAIIIEKIN